LLKLYDIFEDENRFIIIVENIEGQTIFDYVRSLPQDKFTEKQISEIMQQLLSGLSAIHKNNLAHRNIKPDNIIFYGEPKKPKIWDFGFTRILKGKNEKFNNALANPIYISPEMAARSPYDKSSDIWSLGVVCFVLLGGTLPYKFKPLSTPKEILIQIESKVFSMEDFNTPAWKAVSDHAKDFVLKMLEHTPEKRGTADSLLEHPWIKNPIDKPADPESIQKAMENITQYQQQELLQKVVYQYLTFKCDLTAEEKEIRKIFADYDVDKSGTLSREEISKAFAINGITMTDSELTNLFNTVDTDVNSGIDINEFLKVFQDQKVALKEKMLQDAFNVCDTEHNKQISCAVLKIALKRSNLTNDQIESLFKTADADNSGKVFFLINQEIAKLC